MELLDMTFGPTVVQNRPADPRPADPPQTLNPIFQFSLPCARHFETSIKLVNILLNDACEVVEGEYARVRDASTGSHGGARNVGSLEIGPKIW